MKDSARTRKKRGEQTTRVVNEQNAPQYQCCTFALVLTYDFGLIFTNVNVQFTIGHFGCNLIQFFGMGGTYFNGHACREKEERTGNETNIQYGAKGCRGVRAILVHGFLFLFLVIYP